MEMKYHPEQKDNEIYMGNFWFLGEYSPLDFRDDFKQMNWSSRRLGNIPYDKDGGQIINTGYKPGFITIENIQNQIDQLRWEIENVPCSWNGNKLESIRIFEKMIQNRTCFND